MAQLNIDCEGPLTINDNAFELCCELIPQGGELFAKISKYDDYLADIEKRHGYKAGDTLKLILPFLKAFGCTNSIMEDFSARTILLLPGTEKMLPFVKEIMPSFIISTSYRPYLNALAKTTLFPSAHIYCTDVDMEMVIVSDDETENLTKIAQEILSMPMLDWSDDATSVKEIDDSNREIVQRLDRIFWDEIMAMEYGRFIREINPVGGQEKAESVRKSLVRTGNNLSNVLYAGDSITDVQALELTRQGGGLAISFNGNSYSVKAAEWAALSGNTALIGAVAHLVETRGASCLKEMPLDSAGRCEGTMLLDWLSSKGVANEMMQLLYNDQTGITPVIINIDMADCDTIIMESERVRKEVRGITIGELG